MLAAAGRDIALREVQVAARAVDARARAPQLQALGDGLGSIQRLHRLGELAGDTAARGDPQPGTATLLVVLRRLQRLVEGGDGLVGARHLEQKIAAQHRERMAKLALLRQLRAALRQPQRAVVAEAVRLVLRRNQMRACRARILGAIQVLGVQRQLLLAVPLRRPWRAARACGCAEARCTRPPG